jgi:hypothetical protein
VAQHIWSHAVGDTSDGGRRYRVVIKYSERASSSGLPAREMDIIWQQVVPRCDRPLEVLLLCREVYASLSENDVAASVARRLMTKTFPNAKRARTHWSRRRNRPRHVYFDASGRQHSYHPSVLVAYVCGYLQPEIHVAVVRQLVKMGARHVDVALQFAAKLGSTRICEYLVTHSGAMVHRCEDIALRLASRAGRVDVVDFLLSQGADATARNSDAVRLASYPGHCEVISRLLDNGAQARSASLIAACAADKADVVELLLRRGAPVNNISALDWALDISDTLPLRLLLQHGLDPALADRRSIGRGRPEHRKVTKEFMAGSADESERRLTVTLASLALMYDKLWGRRGRRGM